MGRLTTTTYNSRGWVSTVTDPLGNVTTYSYTATGKIAGVSDPSGGGWLVSYAYDSDDRLTTLTDALTHTKVTVYDEVGNVSAQVDALGHGTTFAYDAVNQLTTITDALGHDVAVFGYDSGGNKISVTDALAHTTNYGFDALNRVTTITDALSGVTAIAFDEAGRTKSLTDPDSNTTTWAYNAADRLTTITHPIGTTTLVYDNGNQLADTTDRNSKRITFAYDSGGRRTSERWLDTSGGTVRNITYTYNADGEVTKIDDPDATLNFTFDSGGRMTAAGTSGGGTGQPSVTLTYGYNAANDRASMTDNLASVGRTSYGYDAAHHLTTLTRTLGGSGAPGVVFGFDAADRLISESRTIGGGGTAVNSTFTYDDSGRLTTLIHSVAGGSVLATYGYVYDNASRLANETNAEGLASYSYDNTNQLTGADRAGTSNDESYGYDANGNRNTTGYTTASDNRMTASPGYTYTYDSGGNTSAKTETATGNVTTYSYDHRNRLTGVTEKDNKGAVVMQATYTYDALNRRIKTEVDPDGAGAGSPVVTWTAYDGMNPYADFDGTGTLATRYLYGPAVDELFARTTSGGTSAWYLTDHLGSVRDIANTSGTVIDHLAYDSFGNIASESNAGNGDRFKFTAREYDSVVKLQENRNRYYGATTGRWTQQDPIGFVAGDPNLFRYVTNKPENAVDPSGCLKFILKGSNWTPGDMQAVTTFVVRTRTRIPSLIKEVETFKGSLKQADLKIIGGDLDELLRILHKMQSIMSSKTQKIYTYHYINDPWFFDVSAAGRDATMFVSRGNFWDNLVFNDLWSWRSDFGTFFHEMSHLAGTTDSHASIVRDAADWGGMGTNPFNNSTMYDNLMTKLSEGRAKGSGEEWAWTRYGGYGAW